MMDSIRIGIIHWLPLEQYPPATNLLTVLGDQAEFRVCAYSTHNTKGRKPYAHSNIEVFRSSFPTSGKRRLSRLLDFTIFPLLTFLRLLRLQPKILIYLEPHSAMAAWMYCMINRRCRLFIHYHEYRDTHEYQQPGMRIVAWYHWLERHFLYSRAEWISHTNQDRVDMFLSDLPSIDQQKMHTLANRPPASWWTTSRCSWPTTANSALRLAYVGAVSLHDTFIEPLVAWAAQQQHVELDIYTNNVDQRTHEFLVNRTENHIKYFENGVEYDELPSVLSKYHVGVILYRGNTRNYIYNAPNKLFEYLACGLDVWYPKQMKGIVPYRRSEAAPRIIELDFEALEKLDTATMRKRPKTAMEDAVSCEVELGQLHAALVRRR